MLLNLLTALFVGLKLSGFIDWSWFLVVLPSLIPTFIIAVVAIVMEFRK